MKLTKQSQQAWVQFLSNQHNHGHAKRVLYGSDINTHVQACWRSAQATVQRIKKDLPDLIPGIILEIGSSAGLNCFALQQAYPKAEVFGIDPEQQAVNTAIAMLRTDQSPQPYFERGFGEQLLLSEGTVDLIVCHTVIEHVDDVEAVIREMARVLSCTGVIHLDAPNYLFPYEPHLEIFTIPVLGKQFVKFTALLQGRWSQRNFIDHLKFITPRILQHQFEKYGLQYHNRAIEKLQIAARGKADIKKYVFIAKLLQVIQKVGLASLIVNVVAKLGLYPSVLYTLKKP